MLEKLESHNIFTLFYLSKSLQSLQIRLASELLGSPRSPILMFRCWWTCNNYQILAISTGNKYLIQNEHITKNIIFQLTHASRRTIAKSLSDLFIKFAATFLFP